MRKTPSPYRGFDFLPGGYLLTLRVDMEAGMGFCYERCLELDKKFHSLDRMAICFARGSTRAFSECRDGGPRIYNDVSNGIVKRTGAVYRVKGITPVYDTISFLPSHRFIEETGKELGFSAGELRRFESSFCEFPRSPWLTALIEEYFARRVLQARPFRGIASLEKEILGEVISLVTEAPSRKDSGRGPEVPSWVDSPGLFRAITAIETHLFSPLQIEQIARASAMSAASLNRVFRRVMGCAPASYVRRRRLEEAASALRKSGKSVEEIATLVGYESVSAFVRAFRKQYQEPPHKFRRG